MSQYHVMATTDHSRSAHGRGHKEPSAPRSGMGNKHSQTSFDDQSRLNLVFKTNQSDLHSMKYSPQLGVERRYFDDCNEAGRCGVDLCVAHPTGSSFLNAPRVDDELEDRLVHDLSTQRDGMSANSSPRPSVDTRTTQPPPLEGIGSGLTIPTSQYRNSHTTQNNPPYNPPYNTNLSRRQLDQNVDYLSPNFYWPTESSYSQQDLNSCQLRANVDTGAAPWSPEVMGGGMQQIQVPVAIDTHGESIGTSDDSFSQRIRGHCVSSFPTDRDEATPISSLNTPPPDLDAGNEILGRIPRTSAEVHPEIGEALHLPEASSTGLYGSNTLDRLYFQEYDFEFQARASQGRPDASQYDRGTHTMPFINDTQHLESSLASPMPSIVMDDATPPTPPMPEGCLACPVAHCDSLFNGQYRKGNLARHERLKHGPQEKTFPCAALGCGSNFKRLDARLKHYRKHHQELNPGIANTRKPLFMK